MLTEEVGEVARAVLDGDDDDDDYDDYDDDDYDWRECIDPLCGYDDTHNHGGECTTGCPCGLGTVEL